MKKHEMPSAEALRALYPSHTETDNSAVRATLAGLFDNEKEKPVMKKKLSAALVCACILLAAACVAIAVSTNVFGLFAEQYGRGSGMGELLTALDDKSAKDGGTQTVAPSSDNRFNQVDFTVEQSFYDGETLFISYSLKNAGEVTDEAYLPAEGDFDKYRLSECAIVGVSSQEQAEKADLAWMSDDPALNDQLKAIQDKGGKQGLIRYTSYLGDGAYWGEGEDDYINLSMSDEKRLADGTLVGYKRFETPLPDAVRGKEQITIRFSLYRAAQYIYFDGETWFIGSGERTKEALYAAVSRTAAEQTKTYPFSAEFAEYSAEGVVTVSPIEIQLDVQITSNTGEPMFEDDEQAAVAFSRYQVYAGGEQLRAFSSEYSGEGLRLSAQTLYNRPAQMTDSLTLVPVFTDRAKERAGWKGSAERPGEAIVVALPSAAP